MKAKKVNTKIAIFDICGTLYYNNTTYSFLNWLIYIGVIKYNKNIMDAPYILRAMNVILSRFFKKDIYRELQLKQLAGLSLDYVNNLAVDFVEAIEMNRISDTDELVCKYKNNGYTVIIASATIRPIAQAIASKLGVVFFSSEIEFLENTCTGRLSSDLLYSKRDVLLPLIKRSEEVIVITDNYTDKELVQFSHCSHIVVNDDKDIRLWNKLLKSYTGKVEFIKKQSNE